MAPRGGYRQPERLCGRCGRVDEIARRSVGGEPDICVNCYRLPTAVCGSCGKMRPCNHVNEGRPICKNCSPRTALECAHCGLVRPPTARWPEGPVCDPCYVAALGRRGACAGCGHERRLVSPPGHEATICCDCAGVAPVGSTCSVCGREDKLYERGRCVGCSLARRATELMAGPDGTVPDVLTGVHDTIVASATPRKALNWLRSGAGAPILAAIANGTMPLTHAALDEHPRPRAADHVRQMLVAHGALGERDEALARLERWINDKVTGINDPDHAKVLRRFATWHTLRSQRRRVEHMSSRRTVTAHARNQINAAIALLEWATSRGIDLADLTQHDIDRWLAGPPSRRYARAFLTWTAQQHLTTKLTIKAAPVRAGSALDSEDRWHIARQLLHDDTIELVDRVAGSFVLLYAQPLSRIAVMTTDQINHSDDIVAVRFALHDVDIPEPLAGLVATLTSGEHRAHVGVGATATTPWLFPGHLPGRPITPSRLGDRLSPYGIDARSARRAALLHLGSQLPAPVLADALGITATTATDWVKAAGGDWANYAAHTARTRVAQPR